jgi:hypothetical protein
VTGRRGSRIKQILINIKGTRTPETEGKEILARTIRRTRLDPS